MTRNVVIAALALAAIGSHAAGVRAQDSLLAELYGQGVHAYNSRNYQQAHDLLTQAIDQGSQDPRCYYFRGLAYSWMGRSVEAVSDYNTGAMLEAKGGPRVYPVSRSLQRIQGGVRLTLEQHRRSARLAIAQEKRTVQQARYEALQRAEADVVRDPNKKPGISAPDLVGQPPAESADDPFTAPEDKPELAPEKPKPTEVVADPAPAPTTEPDAAPTPARAGAETPADPFGGGGTPAAPADPFGGGATPADPFGGGSDTPADPFGGGAPAADPFGGDKPAENKPAPAADPFGGGDTPAADPFGGDKPAENKPAPAADPFGGSDTPAADPFGGGDTPAADDPFADDQPEKKSAPADDPFGGTP